MQFHRPQYFKLLDQCTAQIVLHKSGVDPDFHYTKKFNVDVDNLIGIMSHSNSFYNIDASYLLLSFTEGMVDKAKVEEAEGKIYGLEQQVSRLRTCESLSLSLSLSLLILFTLVPLGFTSCTERRLLAMNWSPN